MGTVVRFKYGRSTAAIFELNESRSCGLCEVITFKFSINHAKTGLIVVRVIKGQVNLNFLDFLADRLRILNLNMKHLKGFLCDLNKVITTLILRG
jgi:hypothetical protein